MINPEWNQFSIFVQQTYHNSSRDNKTTYTRRQNANFSLKDRESFSSLKLYMLAQDWVIYELEPGWYSTTLARNDRKYFCFSYIRLYWRKWYRFHRFFHSSPQAIRACLDIVLVSNVRSPRLIFFFHSFNLNKCIVHKLFMNHNVWVVSFFINQKKKRFFFGTNEQMSVPVRRPLVKCDKL